MNRLGAAARYVVTGKPQVTGRPQAGFDAGRSTRRLKNWSAPNDELNSLMRSSGSTVVRRARQLAQEDGYGASAAEMFAAYLVGPGIRPASTVDDPELQLQVQRLWREWIQEADAAGSSDFYGLQLQVAYALFTDGELFIRRRPRRLSDGLPVPMQLQALEADHVDRTHTVALNDGHQVRSGIEFDAIGRRVAYWMWRHHPGDTTMAFGGGNERRRVPAEEVLHVYFVRRAGQIRGVPRMLPSMIPLKIHGDYDDAEAERKRTTAMLAAFVTSSETEEEGKEGNLLGEGEVDSDGMATADWQPGTVMVLGDGEQVTIASPSDVGGNYEAFQNRTLHKITAGWGLPYSAVTTDVSQANYSSERAAQVQLRRRITPLQLRTVVHQMLRPTWRWFIEEAVLAGKLRGDVAELQRQVKYILPKWEWVDPWKDRRAEQIAVDNLWKPRSDVIEAEGDDPEETDRRIAQDQAREERLALRRGAQGAMAEGDMDREVDEEQRRLETNARMLAQQRETA